MNQYQTERRLCWCYGLLTIFLTITVICLAIPYNHWRATLDLCPGSWLENSNCGCILFGVSTYQYFNGGHNSYCHFVIYAPLPVLLYCLVMTVFHMYRVCINNVGQYEDKKTAAMEEIEGESIVVMTRARVSNKNDAVVHCWIPSFGFAFVFLIYSLVHASIFTNGFNKTCTQYRTYLVKLLNVSGDQAMAIHFRLSCQAIFDFMDYLQRSVVSPNDRRDEFINTGLSLHLALIACWLAVCVWVVVSIFTAIRTYKERHVITCCGN